MKYTFGPVPSRRLGLSLGVDLVGKKICSLNCLYCECGPTSNLTLSRREYVPANEVLNEFREVLRRSIEFDWVTFSGYGEPLLNSEFYTIAKVIKDMVGERLALLTNGTLFMFKDIRDEASVCDYVLPSLDAGSEETFQKLNRPYNGLTLGDLVKGIRSFKKEYPHIRMALEIVFVKGINDSEEELTEIKKKIEYISPDEVHLNTVVRPPAYKVEPVDFDFLLFAKDFIGHENTLILGLPRLCSTRSIGEDILLSALKRRPLTYSDLISLLGNKERVESVVEKLEAEGILERVFFAGKAFYRLKEVENE